MPHFSSTAMILAAGLGQRMRPLTLAKPKPLLEVGGRTMLDRALDKLVAFGLRRAVVNTFYLAEQIEARLATRRDIEIVISREDELLDTGGGIREALPYFGGHPFFVLNADLPWTDGAEPTLARMAKTWNPAAMDVLLLMMKTAKARGFDGKGDFTLDSDGRAHRKNIAPPRPYVMLSAQIVKPELYKRHKETVFSNNLIWNEAEERNRLFGIEHQGSCYHIGTPEDLEKANALLADGRGWDIAA